MIGPMAYIPISCANPAQNDCLPNTSNRNFSIKAPEPVSTHDRLQGLGDAPSRVEGPPGSKPVKTWLFRQSGLQTPSLQTILQVARYVD